MTPPRKIRRICAFCNQSKFKSELVTVTQVPKDREIWNRRLGKQFLLNCNRIQCPFICYSHFPPEKLMNPRSKILPYQKGIAPETTNQDESEDDQEERDQGQEEEEIVIEDEFVDDNTADPDYQLPDEPPNEIKATQFQNVLCNWEQLLPCISKCWQCLRRGVDTSADSTLRQEGAALEALFQCANCLHSWSWKSSKVLDREGKPGKKQQEVNLRLAVSIFSTGNRLSKISALFKVLDAPFFSERRYNQLVKNVVAPAVERVYTIQRTEILDRIKNRILDEGGIHLSGDGQFDSRGYSAYICRFSVMDITSNLVLDFEVSRKPRGGNSMLLEKKGHEICLPRLLQELEDLSGHPNPVQTFTTDRCTNLAQVMKNYPSIAHHYDAWHWIRSVRKDIGEKSNQKQFEPLKPWVQRFINHIHTAIRMSNGDGTLAYQIIMSFFYHVQGIHANFQAINGTQFTKVQSCMHSASMTATHNDYLDLQEKNAQEGLRSDVLHNDKAKSREGSPFCLPTFFYFFIREFPLPSQLLSSKRKFFENIVDEEIEARAATENAMYAFPGSSRQ